MTNFETLIRSRKSTRTYRDTPVQREHIIQCIEAGRLAPSACNVQPWKFIVVDERAVREKLCSVAFSHLTGLNRFAVQAPVIIAVIADRDIVTNRFFASLKGLPYYLLDIGAACEQLLLQAEELGIGTCWIGWFKEKPIKKLLHVPRDKKIVSLITMGYADEKSQEIKEKNRKKIEQILSFNTY